MPLADAGARPRPDGGQAVPVVRRAESAVLLSGCRQGRPGSQSVFRVLSRRGQPAARRTSRRVRARRSARQPAPSAVQDGDRPGRAAGGDRRPPAPRTDHRAARAGVGRPGAGGRGAGVVTRRGGWPGSEGQPPLRERSKRLETPPAARPGRPRVVAARQVEFAANLEARLAGSITWTRCPNCRMKLRSQDVVAQVEFEHERAVQARRRPLALVVVALGDDRCELALHVQHDVHRRAVVRPSEREKVSRTRPDRRRTAPRARTPA